MARPRGRPRIGKSREHIAIALTVNQLIMWGFSGRGEVFEAVGAAARIVFGRRLRFGDRETALGPDRIEQIWEDNHPPTMFERLAPPWPKGWGPKPSWKHRYLYTKRGLQRLNPRPDATVQELAEILLQNDGKWPWPTERVWRPLERKWEWQEISRFQGAPELSKKGRAELDALPMIRPRRK